MELCDNADMECTITVDGVVTNFHPILSPEEKDRREQRGLRVLAEIMEKYGIE